MNQQDLIISLPIIIVSTFSILVMVLDALFKNSIKLCTSISVIGLFLTLASAFLNINLTGIAMNGMVKTSSYVIIFDFIFCIAGIITILSAKNYFEKFNGVLNEFYTIILMSISGMLIISHANDLIMIFIGIEIMSICFYILTGIVKKDLKGNESSVKYFLLGAFATGFLMYGIALLYGSFGSTNFTQISSNSIEKFSLLTICGVSFIVIGFSFKVGIFPFHQWVPDVYEGAPTIVTGFMSTAGKAAAFSGFVSVMAVIYPKLNSTDLTLVIAVLSAITMLSGNILALSQTNIKRMLAYSSISHAGYALMGIASGNKMGYIGVLYYMCAYLFMQLGAFVLIGYLENNKSEYIQINDFIGFGKTNPRLALILSLFMLSLLGIPPFAGFFGKYYLFLSAINSGRTWLAIVGVISSVISAWFYLGIIVNMFFKSNETNLEQTNVNYSKIVLGVLVTGTLVIGFIPELILSWTK